MAAMAKVRENRQGYRTMPNAVYDGSAVRRLEREEVLQPRPRTRTRERRQELVRPKVQVREAGAVSLFAVTGFAAVAVFAVLLLFSFVELNALSADMVTMEREMVTLKSEEAVLRAQYELSYDLGTIEQNVLDSGAMVKPQSSQMIYVNLSEPDTVKRFDREAQSGLAGLIESAKGVLSGVVEYFN